MYTCGDAGDDGEVLLCHHVVAPELDVDLQTQVHLRLARVVSMYVHVCGRVGVGG